MFLWKIHNDPLVQKKERDRDNKDEVFYEWDYTQKNVIFSCVVYKPETKYSIYAVGTDKSLKEIENGKDK